MRERSNSRRGKLSIWQLFSPEWDRGAALGQALGAAAMSADRALPHVALQKKQCFLLTETHIYKHYWPTLYKMHIQCTLVCKYLCKLFSFTATKKVIIAERVQLKHHIITIIMAARQQSFTAVAFKGTEKS